jgi:hypothetical protein
MAQTASRNFTKFESCDGRSKAFSSENLPRA